MSNPICSNEKSIDLKDCNAGISVAFKEVMDEVKRFQDKMKEIAPGFTVYVEIKEDPNYKRPV